MRVFTVRGWAALILIVAAASLAGIGGLHGIRAVESYDPFCTVCHLQDHQDYLDDGRRAKAEVATLGGWHLAGGEVRCISCHGEDGLLGMARTTWLASKDVVKFVLGDYEQPSRVFHPLPDKECLKCHPVERILELKEGAFHAIIDHTDLKAGCVGCHAGHDPGGKRDRAFIVPAFAQPRCDVCHKELEQKVRAGG